jgi:hypothetical protein
MTADILRLMGYFSRNRQSIFIGFVVGLIVFMLLGEWAYSRFIGPAKWETSVPTTFDLRTPKEDCGGPWTCRISFTLAVAPDDNPGTTAFRCDVRALDQHGSVVASGKVRASLGTMGMVPTQGSALSPKVRRTVAVIDGTCFGIDPEAD